MAKLVIDSLHFYSPLDERAFFRWIKKIRSVSEVSGQGRKILLKVSKPIGDADLFELIALFMRYDIEMSQLAVFASESNKEWFLNNKKAFWYKRAFLKIKRKKP